MRAVLFAIALLSSYVFANVAMACTAVEHVSASKPQFVLKDEDCLSSQDTRYVLYMHKDGTLSVQDKRFPGHPPLWVPGVGTPVPGSTATLKNDGSFVLADPSGKEIWHAPIKLPATLPADY